MKKHILYILISLSFLFISGKGVFADACTDRCKIQDAPAPVLEKYLDTTLRITRSISKKVSESEPTTKLTNKVRNSILGSLGQTLNFSGFFSSFDFYVGFPAVSDIPYPIKRDHERLEREWERLARYLQKIIRSGYGEVSLENICDNIPNCNTSGTARSILVELVRNNKNITDAYRLSVLGRSNIAQQSFIFVPENFSDKMEEYYNKDTISACSSCEEAYWAKIQKEISKIWKINLDTTNWTKKWKAAFASLWGTTLPSIDEKNEERVLKEYLSSQWISGSAADAVTNNLKEYNSSDSISSNPLTNSLNYTFTNVDNTLGNTFKESAIQNFLDTGQEEIPIAIITESSDEIQISKSIQNSLAELYKQESSFAQRDDTGSEKIIAKIIRMHFSIAKSINILDKAIKIAEDVCNSQGRGKGKCSYR